eukprot:g2597.t1
MSQTSFVGGVSHSAGEFRLGANPPFTGTDVSTSLMQQLRHELSTDSMTNSSILDGYGDGNPLLQRPTISRDSTAHLAVKTQRRVHQKRRVSSIATNLTEAERIERRRAINRDSQRRIRERKLQEVEALRAQCIRYRYENEQVLLQMECINAEKANLLRQIQETTEKWQQAINENAMLNREILHLQSERQSDFEMIQTENPRFSSERIL